MATRSTIAILETSGIVKQIYCHWDGYIDHNGRILKEHYNTPKLVKELISHGDLSVLGEEIEATYQGHSFDEQQEGVCVYYGRDRGDEDVSFAEYEDFDWFRLNRRKEDYNYIFIEKENKWYLLDSNCNEMVFMPHLDKLTAEDLMSMTNLQIFNMIKSGMINLETFDSYIKAITTEVNV